MGESSGIREESLPLSRELRVDAVCRSFEAAWQAADGGGVRPRIEDYLAAPGDAGDWPLFRELLKLDLHYRRGENPSPEEYAGRFPQHAERLRGHFAGPRADGLPRVPGYEILAEIACGGMGVVYQARQVALNRVVALKMIRAGAWAGPEERARFKAEAEAVARLQHPNIVQVYEVGEHAGLPYFSLEYCGGGSLAAQLGGAPLPAAEAAGLVATLARAVHAAHQAGIVHRDLKPANVLLAPNPKSEIRNPKQIRNPNAGNPKPAGQEHSDLGHSDLGFVSDFELRISDFSPKITDFGLAKDLAGAAQHTPSGAILGTPSYMAPEQAAGRSKEIGPATDVYALGAILYELLTGRPPFREDTPLDTLVQVLEGEPTLPRRLNPGLPAELELICLKCLEKAPGQRYRSASALADDLERFLQGEAVEARPRGPWQRLRYWARREPALASRLAALALFVAVIQANFHLAGHDQPAVHFAVLAVAAFWALGSWGCQRWLARDPGAEVVRCAWAGAEPFLLTGLLALSGNEAGPLAGMTYALLVAAAGLWFRLRLVWFTTAMAEVAFGLLVLSSPRLRVYPHHAILFAVFLAVLGYVVAYQVRRVRALSRHYEHRPLP
jgi:serine/threonine-protein kinase